MEFYKEQTWFDLVTEKLESNKLKMENIFEFKIDDEWRELKDMNALKKYDADIELNFDTLEFSGTNGENVFTLRYECKRWFLTTEV